MNKESVSVISIVINIFLGLSKIVVGVLSNSAALVADGIHSVTDFLSSLGVFIGIRISKKPADKEHPYGHFAAENISGLGVVFLLVVSAIWIIYDGVQSIINKEVLDLGIWGILVVIASILLNEFMVRLKLKYGKKENSLALIADAGHSRADEISSFGVLIGLIIASQGEYLFADGLLAVFIGLYILRESYNLGKGIVDNLIGIRDEKIEEEIKKYLQQKGIELTSLKTRKIGPVSSAELVIKLDARLKVEEAEEMSKEIQNDLLSRIASLEYIVIQVESHKTRGGYVRPRWGRGFAFKERFQSLGLEKKGYRIIIPFKNGKPFDDFGSSEYLIIDKKNDEIIRKQVIKNPYFQKDRGFGMRFINSIDADEIVVKKIGPGAIKKLKESNIKLTIVNNYTKYLAVNRVK